MPSTMQYNKLGLKHNVNTTKNISQPSGTLQDRTKDPTG